MVKRELIIELRKKSNKKNATNRWLRLCSSHDVLNDSTCDEDVSLTLKPVFPEGLL